MSTNKAMQTLRRLALEYPEAEEGVSCMRAAFKARNKAFLFMGSTEDSFDIMVKLADSLPEAARLASEHPENYQVGAHGWVTARFSGTQMPPKGLLERWLDESFRLLAPKKLVAMMAAKNLK